MSISYGVKLTGTNGYAGSAMVSAANGDTYGDPMRALFRMFEALIQPNIKAIQNAPPGGPANGDTYLVGTVGSGAWSAQSNNLAYWTTEDPNTPAGKWEFWIPQSGWTVYNQATNSFYVWNGSTWTVLISPAGGGGPLTVGQGGTGVATLALNGVLYGNGTSNVLVTAQGASHTVLVANAGAPSFSATPTLTTLTTTGIIAVGTTISSYNGVATVGAGVPSELVTVDLVTQSAAIGSTLLYAVPAANGGTYRISWSATVTTVASTGAGTSTLGGANGFQVIYTSPTDSVAKTTVPQSDGTSSGNTTATAVSGIATVYAKASTNINFTFDYTSDTAAQMVYELHIKVEYLG